MLVTNPAGRAALAEVLNHPWMIRGFPGSPDPHLIRREPLRSDELDRNVIRGMGGFEFGTEEEIEKKLVEVLESDAYHRVVRYWAVVLMIVVTTSWSFFTRVCALTPRAVLFPGCISKVVV